MKNGYFTKDFLENLPPGSEDAVLWLANEFSRLVQSMNTVDVNTIHSDCVEGVAIINAFCKYKKFDLSTWPTVGSSKADNVKNILSWASKLRMELQANVNNRDTAAFMADKKS